MSCAHFVKQKLPLVLSIVLCWLHFSSFAQSQASSDSTIKINEVFPRATADCPEWFEIVNSGTVPVNIKNWHFGRSDDTNLISAVDYMVSPGNFVVATQNKVLFTQKYPSCTQVIQPAHWNMLDNYRDTLCLSNASQVPLECVCWDYKWFDNWTDQSLERVSLQLNGEDKNTWVVSQKPTPGQPNGSIPWRDVALPSLEIGPVPFSPNGDGKDDYLSIKLSLPAAMTADVSIYGFDGRKYFSLPGPVSGQYLWNGRDQSGNPVAVGPFFVVAEVKSGGQKTVLRKKGILWR